MIILGIETSCDETSASVVELVDPAKGAILHSVVTNSSMDIHKVYGGVVPEIAARSHIEAVIPVIRQALDEADIDWDDIDAIGVTHGAGLGGCLLVGVMTARTLALLHKKLLYAINHVEAHIYANFITAATSGASTTYSLVPAIPLFPMLGLIVSGGHSQLVVWRTHFDYTLLGQTHDDAIGEAFDKVAKILGLPYPGGPSVATLAKHGSDTAYSFPKAKLSNKYDFSFSGPKTAVLRAAQAACGRDYTFPSYKLAEALSEAQKADIAASFQRVAVETVVDKAVRAFEEFNPASVTIGGGVAASAALRAQLTERIPLDITYQDPKLMTDNGAMVATLACYQAAFNRPPVNALTLTPVPNLSM